MSTSRKLRIFRIQDGQRIPFTLELDHELTVIAEYADAAVIETKGRSASPPQPSPDGKKATMARWVTKSVDVNPIPGTEGLRGDYFEDLERLQEKHRREGTECSPCEIGRLVRRYREKLEKAGWL